MHPRRERACDKLLEELQSPSPERRVRKSVHSPSPTRSLNLPDRFPLLTIDFYDKWCQHKRKLWTSRHIVDDSAPALYPELYLKPRRLDTYAKQLEANMQKNTDLLKRINLVQRSGGFVDCWMHPKMDVRQLNKKLWRQRKTKLRALKKSNKVIYSRLLSARSDQLLTSELEQEWKETKQQLIQGASLPFILFEIGKIDRGIRDPAFVKPKNYNRTKVAMEIWVRGGAKIGRLTIELFTDITPLTCQLFLSLIRGNSKGHAYRGTRIFRVVPDLYCRGGDVIKDNGYGCYVPDRQMEPMGAETYELRHTVPGVLSMPVTKQDEVYGHFNIIFKPLPQFDGKNVVFGRIIGGPTLALERISAMGRPLGTTSADVILRYCGWYTSSGRYRQGKPNTVKFPPRRK